MSEVTAAVREATKTFVMNELVRASVSGQQPPILGQTKQLAELLRLRPRLETFYVRSFADKAQRIMQLAVQQSSGRSEAQTELRRAIRSAALTDGVHRANTSDAITRGVIDAMTSIESAYGQTPWGHVDTAFLADDDYPYPPLVSTYVAESPPFTSSGVAVFDLRGHTPQWQDALLFVGLERRYGFEAPTADERARTEALVDEAMAKPVAAAVKASPNFDHFVAAALAAENVGVDLRPVAKFVSNALGRRRELPYNPEQLLVNAADFSARFYFDLLRDEPERLQPTVEDTVRWNKRDIQLGFADLVALPNGWSAGTTAAEQAPPI